MVADLVQPGADVQLLVNDMATAQRAHRVQDDILHCVDADCMAPWEFALSLAVLSALCKALLRGAKLSESCWNSDPRIQVQGMWW